MTDLWERLSVLVRSAVRPARYINREWGATYRPGAAYRFCMVYPDTYELGQANQALRILCNAVNAVEGMAAERAFLPAPEFCDTLRAQGVPLFSLESCAPLGEFDAVGITLPHELAATNVLEVLDLAGIPVRSAERGEDVPLVMAGGPCAFNPEPYAPFIDAFSIGEGEEALPELLGIHRRLRAQGAPRSAILRALAQEPGCYVPSLYEWVDGARARRLGRWIEPREANLPTTITKRLFEGFAESPAGEPCVVPFTEVVHDRLNVEILRGCTRGCRFCQAGMVYRPVRERSAENIVASVLTGLAETGYDEVSLTSLSSTDHSQIADILTQLNAECAHKGIRISLPSQRLDAFGVDMAGLVAGRKKGGLTFAPEAGTQRLRDVINKNVTEDDLFSAVDAAFAAGWRRCKLYFMIGLPTETDEDIKGIASLAQRSYDRAKAAVPPDQRNHVRMGVSCALFVPKAQTPFQWDGQIAPEEAMRRVNLLRSSIRCRAVEVSWHDPKTSLVEAVMGRGGRECAAWIEGAWKRGARFDAWSEHFDEDAWNAAGAEIAFDARAAAGRTFGLNDPLPWEHISTGVSTSYLRRERLRAEAGEATGDCSFEACTACGVCPALGSDIQVQEVRHG